MNSTIDYNNVIKALCSGSMNFDQVEESDIPVIVLLASFYSINSFSKIPKKYISEQHESLAAENIRATYTDIEKSLGYIETVVRALDLGMSFSDVHPEYLCKKILLSAIRYNPFLITSFSKETLDLHADEEVFNTVAERDLIAAEFLYTRYGINSFSDDSIYKGIFNCKSDIESIMIMNKFGILKEAVSDGYWIEGNEYFTKPYSLKEAIKFRFDDFVLNNQNAIICLNAYISSFNPADVIQIIESDEQVRLISSLYPKEELLSCKNVTNKIKGTILEAEIGL